MAAVSELEGLLDVEDLHPSPFEEWEGRASDPLVPTAFRPASGGALNHVRWVKGLIQIARAVERGGDTVALRDRFAPWIDGVAGEGATYARMLPRVEEPWIRLPQTQLAHDEDANAEILRTVLAAAP